MDGFRPSEGSGRADTDLQAGAPSNRERELYQRIALLEAQVEERDRLLALLVHELTTPLMAVDASLPFLANCRGTPHAQRAFATVKRQMAHLERIVEALADSTRLNYNMLELQEEQVDLRELTRDIGAIARRDFTEPRNQELLLDIPPGPVIVEGDPTRLEQILLTLVEYASRHTPVEGHIQVSLQADEQLGKVYLRVIDDGHGIEASALPHIFDVFYRPPQPSHRSTSRLGLGLSMVKALVELHQGEITAHSKGRGRGTEMVIELPLAKTDHEEDQEKERRTLRPGARRILLVEDNEDTGELLASWLEAQGHHVRWAKNGLDAVEQALADPPDLSFVDLGLPGINGFEVARRLRADPATRDVPLIALTGYGSAQHREESERAGFDHHLVKPATPAQLLALIEDPLAPTPARAPI